MPQHTVKGYGGLLAALKKKGYEGGDDVASVREFLDANGIEVGTDAQLAKARKEYMAADVNANEDGSISILLEPEAAEGDKMDGEEDEVPEGESKAARYAASKSLDRIERRFEAIETASKSAARVEVMSVGEKEWSRNKAKKGSGFDTYRDAEAFGHWMIANTGLRSKVSQDRVQNATKALGEYGIKTNVTSYTALGGAVVPDGFIPDIWAFDTAYGVTREHAEVTPMSGTTDFRPKNSGVGGGFTHHWVAEGTAATASSLAFEQIALNAQEGKVLGWMSKRLLNSSAANLGDFAARKIKELIDFAEDDAAFNGDGSASKGGVNGILSQFGSSAASDSRSVTGGGTAMAHTAANLRSVIGKLPQRYRTGAAWYVPRLHRSIILDRLAPDFGQGITAAEVQGLGFMPMFLNFPVVEVEVMPGDVDAGGARIDLLFGRLDAAVMLGDKQTAAIEMNVNERWSEGLVGIQGEHDVAINAHELGTTTDGGPLVALWQS